MPRFFPVVVRKTVEVPGPGDSSDVTVEQLRYDRPEVHRKPVAAAQPLVSVGAQHPVGVEDAAAGVRISDFLDHPDPAADHLARVRVNGFAGHPGPMDEQTLLMRVFEDHPEAMDLATLITVAGFEQHSDGTEEVLVKLNMEYEFEHPVPQEEYGIVIAQVPDPAPPATDTVFASAYSVRFPNGHQHVSGTQWTNMPNVNNSVGNHAFLRAASSGLGGLSSNTVTGIMRANFANFADQLSWLNLVSVQAQVEVAATSGGLPVGGGHDSFFDFWLTNPTLRVVVAHVSANTGGFAPMITLTNQIAGDWNRLAGARFEGDGWVQSGTGVGAAREIQWRRALVVLDASRTLT